MGAFIELFAEDISYFSNWVNKETERKEAWKQCNARQRKGYQKNVGRLF